MVKKSDAGNILFALLRLNSFGEMPLRCSLFLFLLSCLPKEPDGTILLRSGRFYDDAKFPPAEQRKWLLLLRERGYFKSPLAFSFKGGVPPFQCSLLLDHNRLDHILGLGWNEGTNNAD